MRALRFTRSLRTLAMLAIVFPCAAKSQSTGPLYQITGDRKDWEAWFDHGMKVLRQSTQEAEESFQWAMQLDPTRAEPLFAFYAVRMIRIPRQRTVQYLRGEQEAMKDPEILRADSARTRALMRNPLVHRGLEAVIFDELPGQFRDDRDTRAWLSYSNGDLLRAIELHTSSIERLGARARWVYFDRALAYAAAGNRRAALGDLRTLLTAMRADDDAGTVTFYRSKHFLLYMIGVLQVAGNNLEGAKTSYGESLVEDASFAYAHAGLAQIARAQRRFQDAVDELTMAIELAPSDGVLYHTRAANLLSLNRSADAAVDFQRARELEPRWPAPVYGLGQVAERQQRTADARALFVQFVEMAPAADPQARQLRQRLGLGGS